MSRLALSVSFRFDVNSQISKWSLLSLDNLTLGPGKRLCQRHWPEFGQVLPRWQKTNTCCLEPLRDSVWQALKKVSRSEINLCHLDSTCKVLPVPFCEQQSHFVCAFWALYFFYLHLSGRMMNCGVKFLSTGAALSSRASQPTNRSHAPQTLLLNLTMQTLKGSKWPATWFINSAISSSLSVPQYLFRAALHAGLVRNKHVKWQAVINGRPVSSNQKCCKYDYTVRASLIFAFCKWVSERAFENVEFFRRHLVPADLFVPKICTNG